MRDMLRWLLIHLQNKLVSCLILGWFDGGEENFLPLPYLSLSSQPKKEANWYVISSLCVFVPTETFLESLKEILSHFQRDFMQLQSILRMLFFHLSLMLPCRCHFSPCKKIKQHINAAVYGYKYRCSNASKWNHRGVLGTE